MKEKKEKIKEKVFEANSQASGKQVLLTFKNPNESSSFQDNLDKGCFVKHNFKIKNERW